MASRVDCCLLPSRGVCELKESAGASVEDVARVIVKPLIDCCLRVYDVICLSDLNEVYPYECPKLT